MQSFQGALLPGRDFTDASLLAKGKRVLVIGGGKTAADVAAASSAVAAETTLLFRRVRCRVHVGVPCVVSQPMVVHTCMQAHWTVPQVGGA